MSPPEPQDAPAGEPSGQLAEEESGLVGIAPDGYEVDDWVDEEDVEDYEDEKVSPERWAELLQQAGGDPLKAAVLLIMSNRDEWRGSPSELLAIMKLHIPETMRNHQDWPKNPSRLTVSLKIVAPALHAVGIDIDHKWQHKGKLIRILRAAN